MPFPLPNTVCFWWGPGVPLDVFGTTAESICQQLKPLIPYNEFQDAKYPRLIYRFALMPSEEIVPEEIYNGVLGIPYRTWVACFRVKGYQTVNRSPNINYYHYLVCEYIGLLDNLGVLHDIP